MYTLHTRKNKYEFTHIYTHKERACREYGHVRLIGLLGSGVFGVFVGGLRGLPEFRVSLNPKP